MDIKFNSAYELYNKVLPALRVKRRELNKKGKNVKEISQSVEEKKKKEKKRKKKRFHGVVVWNNDM